MIELFTVFKTQDLKEFLNSLDRMSELSGNRPLEPRAIKSLINQLIKEKGKEIKKPLPVKTQFKERPIKEKREVKQAKDFSFQLGQYDRT